MLKFKAHKIRNVEKTVCCVEQKIAYNIAFRLLDWGRYLYDTYYPDKAFDLLQKSIRENYLKDESLQKYNTDLIFCILNYNLKNYLDGKKSGICWSYEEIGKVFPVPYEIY